MKFKLTVALLLVGSIGITTGCASKKYVRQQSTPVINRVNELDELTAKNTNAIRDVDARARQGIQGAQAHATQAEQRAVAAGQAADQAHQLAQHTSGRVELLANTVANLDNYQLVAETSVHFGFDKAELTSKEKKAIDLLAAELPNTRQYIVEVEGGTDSVGNPQYNYQLSQRRAAAVVQYLTAKHGIPAHKIFVIGLGEDKSVENNSSASGRAKNRRVDVRLMSSAAAPQSAANVPQQ